VKVNKAVLLSSLLLVSFVAQASDSVDPLEGFNRKVYGFNKVVDNIALKPLAKGYQAVTPDLVEAGVSNFFGNLQDVGTLVNNVLQFKMDDALTDFGRIAFNTTIGLAGVIDVSSEMGLKKNREDFGQTLGAWGVSSGPYIVMPFFGPSTLRDAPASFVPLDAWGYVEHVPTRNVGYATRFVDSRAKLFEYEKLVSGDEYIFVRDAYLGLRKQAVNDGVIDEVFNEDDF
jgi:phospholipid-binding lipoprotein MlaA